MDRDWQLKGKSKLMVKSKLVLMNSTQCSGYTYFAKACPNLNTLLAWLGDYFSVSFYRSLFFFFLTVILADLVC